MSQRSPFKTLSQLVLFAVIAVVAFSATIQADPLDDVDELLADGPPPAWVPYSSDVPVPQPWFSEPAGLDDVPLADKKEWCNQCPDAPAWFTVNGYGNHEWWNFRTAIVLGTLITEYAMPSYALELDCCWTKLYMFLMPPTTPVYLVHNHELPATLWSWNGWGN